MRRIDRVVGVGLLFSALGRLAPLVPTMPIRPLGPVVASAVEPITGDVTIRAVPHGRVLVNDKRASRLLLFDSTLTTFVSVADTTSETAKAYGEANAELLPFNGDSSLLSDVRSQAFLVIDPAGKIARTMAMPSPLASGSENLVGFDMAGHFVSARNYVGCGPVSPGVGDTLARGTGTDPVLRVAVATRKVDTLTELRVPVTRCFQQRTETRRSTQTFADPLPTGDSWAMMPDGTVAVIREHDYHIDWITPDGRIVSTPKIAHTWEPLTDSFKEQLVDSLRRSDSVLTATLLAGRVRDSLAGRGAFAPAVMAQNGPPAPPATFVRGMFGNLTPQDLPDYRSPFVMSFAGLHNIQPDAEGNLWIRTNPARPLDGGPVYDVVNRQGVLVDRVQLPGKTMLAGFGPGVVYLVSREGAATILARARIH